MKNQTHNDPANAPPAKKPYVRPELRTFGALHKLTQGSMSAGNDGAGGMTAMM
ncbi:hypothetical protein [Terricaulis silvestris]|uniref:Lasso RiPP family leader peptide-containing protein n=1 Tax=Terricaulis silvestris TaxID=2686094 RepID=A0A6I6MJX3_9CAUL|nr:hypothetical protein [Terricaulis silvestris]QGZ93386.1 hypothetical protein DSM104635_00196 [Terricaulis silvestris]